MNLPKRKPNRLKDYDYSQSGYYFVTFCTDKRKEILSDIEISVNNVGERIALPKLNKTGKICEDAILNISEKYAAVNVEKYVIMPNHIHIILKIEDGSAMRSPTLSTVINQMKGYVSKQLGVPIWLRSFHDHIIRNENDYLELYQYIENNPSEWQNDEYYV